MSVTDLWGKLCTSKYRIQHSRLQVILTGSEVMSHLFPRANCALGSGEAHSVSYPYLCEIIVNISDCLTFLFCAFKVTLGLVRS
jgi:hypothetical protein